MTLIYFIIILSLTIFVHELGHFLFAKKSGIHVYEFCIGMGPRIFKFTRPNDETEYGIRLFPIGGFCSMAGEGAEEDKKIPQDKLLQSKTWGEKFLTIVAGVMFNFIFCIIILFIVGIFNGYSSTKPVIYSVNDETNNLKVGDLITKVNGVKISTIDRFMLEYQIGYGNDLNLTVLRDNEEINITITPKKIDDGYQYGFNFNNETKKGIIETFKYGITKFFSLLNQMFVTITYLFKGKISISNLSGPIGIYNIVGQSAEKGILNLIYLMGYLSLNVGVINLLPLPAFDGGRLLFLIIEKIVGRPINPNIENIIHSIGFILLMILMIAITYNDIFRFIIK